MITIFEKYISQFYGDDEDVPIKTFNIEDYKKIIDIIANWYYDEYNLTFLGSGSYGSVFRVNNEKNIALKITSDQTEANNVSYLSKKINVKGIVDYYDIRQFDIYENDRLLETVYSILMEKLYNLADIELNIYKYLLSYYFRTTSGKIDLYSDDVQISRDVVDCSWKEFELLNPNKIDKFIDSKYNNEYALNKFDIDEVKRLANIYYEDIMGLVKSVLKYDLILCDIHEANICKTEDEHIKVIDIGGYGNSKPYRNKRKIIRIDIDKEHTQI